MDVKLTFCVLCFCSILLIAQCQHKLGVIVRSFCPKVKVMENLNVSRLAGKWYEVARHPNPWEMGKCVQLNQSYSDDGTLDMHWEQLIEAEDDSLQYDDAKSSGFSFAEPARMNITFSKPYIPYPTPYWILDTDYSSYYVAYACHRYKFTDPDLSFLSKLQLHVEFSWIMSRSRDMDYIQYLSLKKILRDAGAFIRLMVTTSQEFCEEDYRQYKPKNVTK